MGGGGVSDAIITRGYNTNKLKTMQKTYEIEQSVLYIETSLTSLA